MFVVMEKGKIHEYFHDKMEKPVDNLKDTVWEGRQDVIIFPIPIAVPMPFGITVPSGNMTDLDHHCEMWRLGAKYEFHTLAMQEGYNNYDIVNEIIRKLKS